MKQEQQEQKLTAELTEQEIADYQAKADGLALKEGVSKVHPVAMIDPDSKKRSVAFLREPNYGTKIKVMDKSITSGVFTAADELRQACIIREESDPLFYGEGPECDEYKMGLTDYCLTIVNRLNNQLKKK